MTHRILRTETSQFEDHMRDHANPLSIRFFPAARVNVGVRAVMRTRQGSHIFVDFSTKRIVIQERIFHSDLMC